jgi:hypothetical protein
MQSYSKGIFGCGLIYRLVPPASGTGTWSESIVHAFAANSAGCQAQGVVADSQGRLYGTAGGGPTLNGVTTWGVVFMLTPSASGGAAGYSVLHTFSQKTDYTPNRDLTIDSNGTLYGSSTYAGTNTAGQVFRITTSPSVAYGVIHTFTGSAAGGDAGGGLPYASVTPGPGGVLYGTTISGGVLPAGRSGTPSGVVYSMTPQVLPAIGYKFKVLYTFNFNSGSQDVQAGVTVDPSGTLFGISEAGSGGSPGSIFKLKPPAAGAIKWSESEYPIGANGYSGAYRMIEDGSGALYGVTQGEIFKYQP